MTSKLTMTVKQKASGWTTFFFLILFVATLATASPTNRLELHSSTLLARNHDNLEPIDVLNCETERSSDYYGLGVRLGVYFAWFSAWIANVCVPSEIAYTLDTNALFLFAVLISMVRCTITGLLLQLDGLLLMHIGGGTIFSVLSVWGYRTCTFHVDGPKEGMRRFGGWGTHFRLLLCMAISTFGLFFWAWGINGKLNADPNPDCQVIYTFMFSRVRADGGIRIFYIFICIACMIYFGLMLLTSLIAVPSLLKRLRSAHREGDDGTRTRHKFATGLTQKQLRQIFYGLRIGNFLFIVYSILLIEFTLNYNNVAGVLGWRGHIFFPSQVIPMVIGAFGFCRVIWIRYVQWKTPEGTHHKTHRTILKPQLHELKKIYSPRRNDSKEFANKRPDGDMDPLMRGQSMWLRLLVSWLPWLGVLRWWKPDYDSVRDNDDRNGRDLESPDFNGWSSESTPRVGGPMHRDTWGSDDTRTELPEIPKDIARFGTI